MTTPEPRLKPTNPATLVVAALAAAALAWIIISTWYGDMPPLPWVPGVLLAALAVIEFLLAQQTRARVQRKPGRAPVEPLAVARYAVLAKASSLGGALLAGFAAGFTVWLMAQRTRLSAADDDLPAAVITLVGAAVLTAAALWLEHSCRVPRRPDEDQDAENRT